METYRTPVLGVAAPNHGYNDLRSTPFSQSTFKVIYDTEVFVPGAGAPSFDARFTLARSLYNVKFARLLWATFPHVADPGDGSGSDELVSVHARGGPSKETMPLGTFISSFPPKAVNVALSNTFGNENDQAVAVLQNTAFPTAAELHYQGNDYDVIQYYKEPITQLSQVNFQFFNSHGLEVGYGNGVASNKVVMCWEYVCAG